MRKRTRKGTALLELALMTPLLLSLFLGCWQFGYSNYLYAGLEQTVHAGARYASLRTYDSATGTPSTAYLTAVRNVVVYGSANPPDSAPPVVPGLEPRHVLVQVDFVKNVPATVTVSIENYPIGTLGQIILHGKPAVQFRYAGVYAPAST